MSRLMMFGSLLVEVANAALGYVHNSYGGDAWSWGGLLALPLALAAVRLVLPATVTSLPEILDIDTFVAAE